MRNLKKSDCNLFVYRTYYNKKNVYPGSLPVTPSTKLVTDRTLTNSLFKYAMSKLAFSAYLEHIAVYATTISRSLGVLYDLRLKSGKDEYYVLIESI